MNYKPIDCNLYDVYIRYIELKEAFDFKGHEVYIKDIYTKEKAEYILLSTGEILRLDHFHIKDKQIILRNQTNQI